MHEGIDQGWTPAQVSRIVNNERYVGDVKVQKTFTEDCLTHKVRTNKGDVPQYVIRNHHPAIVDRELYERTVDYLNAHKLNHTYKKECHELTGMLVCGRCGRFFNVRSNRDNPIWFCPSTALNNGKFICGAERVYEKQVELMLRTVVLVPSP